MRNRGTPGNRRNRTSGNTIQFLGPLRLAAGQASALTFQDTDRDLVRDAGEPFVRSAHQATNEANEIVEYFSSNGTQSATTTGFAYDGSGSLVFDGGHFYVYDAWNRLTEVRQPGDLMVDPDGVLLGTPGLPQERFRYDALGRKVVSELLIGELAGVTRHVYGTGAAVLAEYDVTTDGVGGDQETLARWFVHGEGFPEPLVLVDVTDAGVEIAGTSEVLYYLTDGLGSVGMLADAAGAAAELYMYTPYGPTTIAAPNTGTPWTKSLFGNPLAWTGQRYSPTTALYHFWARSYDPRLGRFLQEDMQGALAAVDISLGGDGQTAGVSGPSAAADGEYVDGLNLFLYAGANPANRFDPFGLNWDEDVDDAIESNIADRAAAVGVVMDRLKMTYSVAQTIASLSISLMPGGDVLMLAGKLAMGKSLTWEEIGMAAGGVAGGAIIERVAVKAFKAASRYYKARKAARAGEALSISLPVLQKLCFGAGTRVALADGSFRPIQELQPGDIVRSTPPDGDLLAETPGDQSASEDDECVEEKEDRSESAVPEAGADD